MILETTNLPPILEIVTETPVLTVVPSPLVTPIISSVQQTPTPIPTPTITTDAPTVTTAIPESNALTAVELRVAKLEKDVPELKTVDHSTEALSILKSQVPSVVDNYLGSKFSESSKKQTPTVDLEQGSEKSALEILQIKREQAEKQQKPKFTIKSIDKATLKENPANHRLYHVLIELLIEDENAIDKGVADTGKKTKRRRTKESESFKKPSSTKETLKGKALSKGYKTGKSALAKELVEEPIAEVIMDDAGDDVACNDNPPQDTSKPKTRKTLNPNWFKQPPRPPTPDPEWNKYQVVLDQPTQPWFNQMVSASKDHFTFNDLMATPINFSKSPSHRTVIADYFFNNDLEYLKTSDPEVTYTTSIMKIKATRYEIKRIEDMVPRLGVPLSMRMTKMLKRESRTRVKDANCGTDL
ncbi:hypothetical protein Tco_1075868, partial [Tanacetum coccineum]